MLTASSKCLLNKDVVPFTWNQGAKKVVTVYDHGWCSHMMRHIFIYSKFEFFLLFKIWRIFCVKFPPFVFCSKCPPTQCEGCRIFNIKWRRAIQRRGVYSICLYYSFISCPCISDHMPSLIFSNILQFTTDQNLLIKKGHLWCSTFPDDVPTFLSQLPSAVTAL